MEPINRFLELNNAEQNTRLMSCWREKHLIFHYVFYEKCHEMQEENKSFTATEIMNWVAITLYTFMRMVSLFALGILLHKKAPPAFPWRKLADSGKPPRILPQ